MSAPAWMGDRRWDVVVVGGGPAGLVAAATLGRHGLDVLVIERRAEPPTLPRARLMSVSSVYADDQMPAEKSSGCPFGMAFASSQAAASARKAASSGVSSKSTRQF